MRTLLIRIIEQHEIDHFFVGPHSREAEDGPMAQLIVGEFK